MKPPRRARLMTGSEQPAPQYPRPQNAADKLRAEALALTGGRATIASPMTGRCDEFAHEKEIRTKTNAKQPIAYVPKQTGARDAAGPPINVNLVQLTSDAKGQVNTSEWMHSFFGHSCGCGEKG